MPPQCLSTIKGEDDKSTFMVKLAFLKRNRRTKRNRVHDCFAKVLLFRSCVGGVVPGKRKRGQRRS